MQLNVDKSPHRGSVHISDAMRSEISMLEPIWRYRFGRRRPEKYQWVLFSGERNRIETQINLQNLLDFIIVSTQRKLDAFRNILPIARSLNKSGVWYIYLQKIFMEKECRKLLLLRSTFQRVVVVISWQKSHVRLHSSFYGKLSE